MASAKVAFVTGGNGITGSAIVEHLSENTDASSFSKVITTSRSPFKLVISDPRVEFIALDFTNKPETLAEQMRECCSEVTHAYFSSYVHRDDFKELNITNEGLFQNFLLALISVAPKLQNVTLQTGGKYYGVHLTPVPSPAREEEPRRGAVDENFYFPQEDFLAAKAKESNWTWNVIRPVAVIGTAPGRNGMNEALTCAMYILTCKKLGEVPRMPTNRIYWSGYEDSSYAPIVADLSIFVSTNPACANEAFNCTNGDYFCWQYMWPRLTSYFGVETSSEYYFRCPNPTVGQPHLELELSHWANEDKQRAWEQLCNEAGCPDAKTSWAWGTWLLADWVFGRTWSSGLSMSKARRFGYRGYIDSYEAFVRTFEKMKAMGQIPAW